MENIINIIGLILNLLGGLSLARGVFISQKEALKLGVGRWAGSTDEENLKLPQVHDKLKQRNWGVFGAILLSIGTGVQIFVQLFFIN
jgi:hypothetical protein